MVSIVDTQSDYPCGVGLGPYTHRLKQSLLIIMSVRETTVSIIVLRGLTRERKSTDEDTFAAGVVVSLRLRSPRKETTMLSTELRGVGQTPTLSYSPVVLMESLSDTARNAIIKAVSPARHTLA